MSVRIWFKAFRLRTLPLALSSIAMGAFLAYGEGAFQWTIFLLCVSTTIFLQVLSNLANDFGDSVHGADSSDRKGPSRAVQSGAISKAAMRRAIVICSILSLVSGLALLFWSFQEDWTGIGVFLLLGLLCIAAALAYTIGRKPYGYLGLGDLSVFIFFGLVGVLGSLYLFTKEFRLIDVLPAASCGLFAVGVLNINNIRDIDSDRLAGKYSVPVRIGREKAIIYHWVLLLSGIAAIVVYTALNFQSSSQWLFMLSLPLFLRNGMAVSKKPATELDPFLKQMALSTLAFVLLFGLGLFLQSH